MSSKIKILIIGFVLFFSISAIKAQDPAFSQYYSSALFLNPALAMAKSLPTVTLNQRSNINRQVFPYFLSQVTATSPIKFERFMGSSKYYRNSYIGGWGGTIYNEMLGPNNEYQVYGASASGAYYVQLSPTQFLSFGIQGGIIQKRIDFSKLTWGSQYDEFFGFDDAITPSVAGMYEEKKLIGVINSGVLWIYNPNNKDSWKKDKFETFQGVAISNMNKPNESFFNDQKSQLPMLFKFHGGVTYHMTSRVSLMPNYLILLQDRQTQYNMGAYLSYYISERDRHRKDTYKVQLGGWYRYNDSAILLCGVQVNNTTFAISYDFNVSTFKYYNRGAGSLEVSFSYSFSNGMTKRQLNRVSHPLM